MILTTGEGCSYGAKCVSADMVVGACVRVLVLEAGYDPLLSFSHLSSTQRQTLSMRRIKFMCNGSTYKLQSSFLHLAINPEHEENEVHVQWSYLQASVISPPLSYKP